MSITFVTYATLNWTDIPSVDAQAKIRLDMIQSVIITRTRQRNKAMIDRANSEYIWSASDLNSVETILQHSDRLGKVYKPQQQTQPWYVILV